MGQPRPLFNIFSSFQKYITNFTTNRYLCEKNVHPVYGAGIRTHDLWNMSLLPLPLDEGSRPAFKYFHQLFLPAIFSRCAFASVRFVSSWARSAASRTRWSRRWRRRARRRWGSRTERGATFPSWTASWARWLFLLKYFDYWSSIQSYNQSETHTWIVNIVNYWTQIILVTKW